jgi:hypothetical protein
MYPVGVKDASTEIPMKHIFATYKSSSYIFAVCCEATGKWLSAAYNPVGYYDEETVKKMRETLKKTEYQFYKVREEGDTLWVTRPVGYWLSDGRLVSPDYQGGERVKAYYGEKSELSGVRSINYITEGPFTFLPQEKDYKER